MAKELKLNVFKEKSYKIKIITTEIWLTLHCTLKKYSYLIHIFIFHTKITGNIKFQADSIFTRFSQNYNISQESSRSRRPFAWTGNRNTDLYRRAKIKTDLYRRANLKQLKEHCLMPWRQTLSWLFFLMTLFLELEMHWLCHLKFLFRHQAGLLCRLLPFKCTYRHWW